MTQWIPGISRPLAATSVATIAWVLPPRNSDNALSRLFCCIPPWIEVTRNPSSSTSSETRSTPARVLQNMNPRPLLRIASAATLDFIEFFINQKW
ncbi:MAG: Uncharacterised protein [Methanobacteriota archaeon]|nr:MAG: Uncharacterised protein [Euryarchaeota archaeon]